MKNNLLLFISLIMLSIGCTNDFGTTEVTFTRATAIYGDVAEIRSTPLVADIQTINNPGKVFLGNDHLLIGEEEKGIHVYDNSDPASPRPLYFLNVPGNKEFYVEGNVIYAESYYDMIKIDINDLDNPIVSGRVENYNNYWSNIEQDKVIIGFEKRTVTIEVDDDDQAFWNAYHGHDEVYFDYHHNVIPHSAVPVSFAGNGSSVGSVNRIVKAQDHIYMINSNVLFIFSDDGTFSYVSDMWVSGQMETVFPQDEQLFIGARNSVSILDISNAANPTQLSEFFHSAACDPVYPYGEVAYVTLRTGDDDFCPGEENSLVTLDITNLRNPTQVSEFDMQSPYGLMIKGDILFVAEGTSGLKIFDIEDRLQPKLLKSITSIDTYDIIAHPNQEGILLLAEPDGFGQYQLDSDFNLSPISRIAY